MSDNEDKALQIKNKLYKGRLHVALTFEIYLLL